MPKETAMGQSDFPFRHSIMKVQILAPAAGVVTCKEQLTVTCKTKVMKESEMKLFDLPASPNAVKVRLVMAHLGLNFEHEMVDLPKGDHMRPEFVQMNPNAKMPVLKDGDFVLWESNAIMLYLAEKNQSDLVPAVLQQRALMHQWMAWAVAHWTPTLGPWLFQVLAPSFFPGFVGDPKIVENCKTDFAKYGPVLEKGLAGKKFLLGDSLSLADFAVAPMLMYAEMMQLPMQEYPNIKGWLSTVQGLPAWSKATQALAHA